jgi:hypothetical protein
MKWAKQEIKDENVDASYYVRRFHSIRFAQIPIFTAICAGF